MSQLNAAENPVALAPSFVVLLGGCVAIYAGHSGFPADISVAAAVLIAAAWIFLGTERAAPGWAASLILIMLLTLFFSFISLYRMNKTIIVPPQITTLAKVLQNREWGKRRALLLGTDYGRFAAYVPPSDAPLPGALVRIRGAVFDFTGVGKGGGFDESLFWRAKGAVKKIILLECGEIGDPGGIYRWRSILERRIKDLLPKRTAWYLLALTLGVRTAELTKMHESAGTLHILAVSGFHVAILAGLVSTLFRKGAVKFSAVSLLIWFYILLAGAPPGGVRAAVMLQVYLLSRLLGRPSSAFNSVSLAGIVLLLYNPWYFFDVGWRLSMLAALFLSALGRLMEGRHAAAASPLVWLVTAPQAAFIFGEVPLAGLFVNPIIVPLFSFVFPLVLILALPSLAGAAWGHYTAFAAEYIFTAWELFSQAAVRLIPWAIDYTVPLLLFSAFIFFAAILGASGFSKIKIAIGALILPLCLLLSA